MENSHPSTHAGGGPRSPITLAAVTAALLAACATTPESPDRAPAAAPGWSVAFEGSASEPVAADGRLYVGSGDGFVAAYDALTGALLWRFDANAAVNATPLIRGGRVFVGSEAGRFFALDSATGRPSWTFDAGHPVSSAARSAGGGVFFVANEFRRGGGTSRPVARGALLALEANSGAERWSFEHDGLFSQPVPAGDLLLVAAGSVSRTDPHWFLHAIDVSSGEPRWSRKLRGRQPGLPIVAEGRLFVAAYANASPAGNRSGPPLPSLYAFDPASGETLWQHRGAPYQSGLRAAVAGDSVFFGTNRGIQALAATSGARLWRWAPGGEVASESLAAGDLVVVPAQAAQHEDAPATDGHAHLESLTHAIEPATGALRWSLAAGENPVIREILDGSVYIQSDDRMTAVDLATGRRRWSFETGRVELHFAAFSAGPIASGERVCFVTRTNAPFEQPTIPGRLFCVDAATGALPAAR
jgi:outer membrane protein assembly factor BamB